MRINNYILYLSLVLCFSFIGCATAPVRTSSLSATEPSMRYQDTISASLFSDDKSTISDEAVAIILDGKIEIKGKNTIAVYKMENKYSGFQKYFGYRYWLSEEYLDLQQQYFDVIRDEIIKSEKVGKIKVMPSILTPNQLSISKLREAAVRMQASLMIIYLIQSDIFEEYHMFSPNEIKAYATCEMILFDTRTGIIPFSEVVTKKHVTAADKSDANIMETRKRAEKEAILDTLGDLSKKLRESL